MRKIYWSALTTYCQAFVCHQNYTHWINKLNNERNKGWRISMGDLDEYFILFVTLKVYTRIPTYCNIFVTKLCGFCSAYYTRIATAVFQKWKYYLKYNCMYPSQILKGKYRSGKQLLPMENISKTIRSTDKMLLSKIAGNVVFWNFIIDIFVITPICKHIIIKANCFWPLLLLR